MTGRITTAVAAILSALAIAACGDEGNGSPATTTSATQPVSPLAARVTELETDIAVYCEVRSGGSASAADDERAARKVQALIGLARRHPDQVRRALAEVDVTLTADCEDSPLQRRVKRALRALR